MLDEWGRFGGISLNPPTFSEKWVNLTGYKIVRNVRKIIKYGEEYLLAKRGDRLERFPKISMLKRYNLIKLCALVSNLESDF